MMFIDNDGEVHPLVGMLPASIEALHLGDVSGQIVMCSHLAALLFEGLPESKSKRLTELTKVSSNVPDSEQDHVKLQGGGDTHQVRPIHSEIRAAGWGPRLTGYEISIRGIRSAGFAMTANSRRCLRKRQRTTFVGLLHQCDSPEHCLWKSVRGMCGTIENATILWISSVRRSESLI